MRKRRKKISRILKVALLLIAIIILVIAVFFIRRGELIENVRQDTAETEKSEEVEFSAINLGSGLKLTDLSVVTGNFPEDGSDEFLEEVLSAEFVNDGDKTLQYAKVHVNIDEAVYTFEFSTLPVGKSLRAFEMNKQTVPEVIGSITAQAENIAIFSEEPSLYEDMLEITSGNDQITVKNISSKDITKEISVFFKNTAAGTYMGGITYRVRIDELKAGEVLSGYSSHASEEGTEIMFVTFGN